jgi:type IV secretory pathway VirB10-like protein
MNRAIKFWVFGSGSLLLLVAGVLYVANLTITNQARSRAQSEQQQKQRETGKLDNPVGQVDRTQAPKDTLLADGKLNPEPNAPPITQQPAEPLKTTPKTVPATYMYYAEVAATPTPTPEPKPAPVRIWLASGTFIPCKLVNTINSSHINTPVVGLVTQDIWEQDDGRWHCIIPSGTRVSSFAQSGAVRDRIEVAGTWSLKFPNDAREYRVEGIACTRQADPTTQQFGEEEGSAGLIGEIVESDHWRSAKALLAMTFESLANASGAMATAAIAKEGFSYFQTPNAAPVLNQQITQMLNGENGDGRYVHVRGGTDFYVFTCETVEPWKRAIGGQPRAENDPSLRKPPSPAATPQTESDKILDKAFEMERQLIDKQKNNEQQNDEPKKIHY